MKEVKRLGDGIREAVFGANDGAVSTLGILSGLVGASLASPIIILVGLLQMFASGMSMGLGAYISTKSQNEYYLEAERQEKREIDVHPAREKARVKEFLHASGMSGTTLTKATNSITKNKKNWLHFLMEERFGIAETSYPHPVFAGLIMFISFVIAGFFPLLPFLFATPRIAIFYSAALALVLLFFVGAYKTRFTRRNPVISGLENFLIGAITAVVGFVIGSVVQSLA